MYFINELVRDGQSRRHIEQLRRTHERVGWGAYSPPLDDQWLRYRAQCEAALARLQTSAYLTGPSAAVAWGLPLVGDPPDAVYVGGIPRGRYRSGLKVLPGHASTTLLNGLLVADPAWTVATCARVMPSRDALIVADSALHEDLCTRDELEQVCTSLRGTPAVGRIRWIIDNADPLAESPGETWTRLVVRQLGYQVVSQFQVIDGDFHARLDFLLEGQLVALEFDGQLKYESGPQPTIDEKRRQAHIEHLGYRVVRVIWEQLESPRRLDARIRNAGGLPVRELGKVMPAA